MIHRALGGLLALLVFFLLAGSTSIASGAEFGIVPGSFAVRMLNAEGQPENRAGAHPDLLQMDFALSVSGTGTSARDFVFELPPGFGGNPNAVPNCPREVFEKGEEECPPESQVGIVRLALSGGVEASLPIFQVEPAPGEFMSFGSVPNFKSPLTMELRPEDFGITLSVSELPQGSLSEGHIELWGIPKDHQQGTTIPRRPMLTTPSRCGPMVFTFRTRSWQEGAPWLTATADTGAPLSGCEALRFDPELELGLSNPVADSPTGLRMDLSMPEGEDASELSNAQLKDATIELPAGVTVSPSGAEALTACSDTQLGLGAASDALCPPSSKVGTVEFASPALREPVTGTIYLGEEHPGERFRLFVVAPGPGVTLKFVGALHADLATGQLSAALRDLPQVPIRHLSMNFDGGPRALLASPLTCGPSSAVARFEPYGGGASVESSVSVVIEARAPGSGCPGAAPFAPQLIVRTSRPDAGRPTSFSATLTRQDGEQLPRRFSITLPAGLSAALGTVQTCPEAEAVVGACPLGSRIGGVLAEAGPGQSPAVLRGDVYLTGPYHRAPFGLLMAFHAAIGSFDLGTMAFHASAQVDRHTGRVTVSTDPLPEVVEGIPIRFQRIELSMDRPGLIRNPTSCAPRSVDTTVEAYSGVSTITATAFPLDGCNRLGFRPRIHMVFERGKGLGRQGKPSFLVSAQLRPGDTNLRMMRLSFPSALKLHMSGLKEICSRQDAMDGVCPGDSSVGTVSARTSLLSEPLTGSIFIVQPNGGGLPDLGLSLGGMGVQVNLTGRTSIHDGHLVTELVGLPDMPFSTFTMRLGGGGEGAFSLDAPLCAHGRPRLFTSTVTVRGQDGARRKLRLPMKTKARCRASSGSRVRVVTRPALMTTDTR